MGNKASVDKRICADDNDDGNMLCEENETPKKKQRGENYPNVKLPKRKISLDPITASTVDLQEDEDWPVVEKKTKNKLRPLEPLPGKQTSIDKYSPGLFVDTTIAPSMDANGSSLDVLDISQMSNESFVESPVASKQAKPQESKHQLSKYQEDVFSDAITQVEDEFSSESSDDSDEDVGLADWCEEEEADFKKGSTHSLRGMNSANSSFSQESTEDHGGKESGEINVGEATKSAYTEIQELTGLPTVSPKAHKIDNVFKSDIIPTTKRKGDTVRKRGGDRPVLLEPKLPLSVQLNPSNESADTDRRQPSSRSPSPNKAVNHIRDTKVVNKRKAVLSKNLPHLPVKSGDWLNSRRMINNFIILESLGTGSYAEVKLVKEKTSGRLYAMKCINREVMKTGLSKQNPLDDIKREIEIMKKLQHPNVLRLFEVMDDPKANKLYLVLEHMEAGDLLTLQKSKSIDGTCNPMDDKELHCVLLQVLLGLMYLHDQKVVHGDIKPQNLLVDVKGMVKIADFGISQPIYGSKQKLSDSAGTPAFMSPEMCSGGEYSGQLADMWAVGATIFMLKFGHPPFVAKSAVVLFEKIQNDVLEFPCEIDARLQDLLIGMLTKNAEERLTLLDVMMHPWVCKQELPAVVHREETKVVTSPASPVSSPKNKKDGESNLGFSQAAKNDVYLRKKLQIARKNLDGKKKKDRHEMLSTEEMNYRSAIFASKKSKGKMEAKPAPLEEAWSSSEDESVEDQDDQMLMTALCLPGFEHTKMLEVPVDEFECFELEQTNIGLKLAIGVVSLQGRRSTQEDRCIILPDLSDHYRESDRLALSADYHMSFVGVYDGHGGDLCSQFMSDVLHQNLLQHTSFPHDMQVAITEATKKTDDDVCTLLQTERDVSGSTGTFAILLQNIKSSLMELWIGHVGDCRAVLSRQGGKTEVVTIDHRPDIIAERERVEQNGGQIWNNRVNGVLAITRAFGDIEFKGMQHRPTIEHPSGNDFSYEKVGRVVSSVPDIIHLPVTPDMEFIVMACDGLWDVLTNQEVTDFVRNSLNTHGNVQFASKELAQEAVNRHSHDNVTVIILEFNRIQ